MRHRQRVAIMPVGTPVFGVLVLGVVLALLVGAPQNATAQRRDRDRPIRVGNTNLIIGGAGYNAHDHATFDANGFVNFAYQHRILRRELRVIPVWARGAVHYASQDVDFMDAYTIWRPDPGVIPSRDELVQERTSDFTIRVELLADLLHSRWSALYSGGGFTVHLVNFSTRARSNFFEDSTSPVAPSAVVGGRLFMPTKPYTIYAEARYGFTYGRFEYPEDRAPTTEDFEFRSVGSVSFEGGVGLHW